ncbi:MAG: hypothetical protein ACI4M1_05410 [Christensenellales bacterium]
MENGMNINDSIHGLIRLTAFEKGILASPEFNRLHDVYQNSTVYLTFPSNRTKRFEHSIGCMYLCSEMFYRAIINAETASQDRFFKDFSEALQKIQENEIDKDKIASVIDKGIIYDNLNLCDNDIVDSDEWRKLRDAAVGYTDGSLIPYNLEEKNLIAYLILIQSLRAAALLHDVGHPPFSHIVEGAIDKAKSFAEKAQRVSDTDGGSSVVFRSERLKDFNRAVDSKKSSKQLHEEMGREISRSVLQKLITDNSRGKADEKAYKSFFEQMVMCCTLKILSDEGEFKYLHVLTDSSLDCDRLDYVVRDYLSSGINAGDLDYKRIISGLKLSYLPGDNDGKLRFCIPAKAINTVESFFKKRCNLYIDVIFHHRVIKTDTLLQDVVFRLIIKFLTEPQSDADERSGGLRSIVSNPDDISGLWMPLLGATYEEKAVKLTQWTDSWLMVVLKRIYYDSFYGIGLSGLDDDDKIVAMELTELLRNVKQFYSLIKRREDFNFVNDGILTALKNDGEELKQKLSQAADELEKSGHENENRAATLKLVAALQHGEFSFNVLNCLFRELKDGKTELSAEWLRDLVRGACEKTFDSSAYADVRVVFKSLSDGLDTREDKDVYFYSGEKFYSLGQISNIKRVLEMEAESIPAFYLYVAPKGEKIPDADKGERLFELGREIGNMLVKEISDCLEKKSVIAENASKGGAQNKKLPRKNNVKRRR